MLDFGSSERLRWDADHLGVTFIVYEGNRAIRCYISRAAIDDNIGYATPGTILDRARAEYTEIVAQVRARIEARAFETDGSIRIKTGDWRRH